MKILITGGAGFIGSHLVDRLVEKNCGITVLDDLYNSSLGNIWSRLLRGEIRFIEGSILDREKVKEAVTDSEAVVHLAALVSVPFSVLNPKATYEVNVDGTKLLLEECAAAGVKKFVFISSCAVYGEARYVPIDELHPTDPLSPYAESKLEAERICPRGSVGELETIILRLFNVYGPRQAKNGYVGVISSFAEQLVKGNPLTIYGDGLQTRDFVHVSDVAEAIWLTLNARSIEGIFNIASGKPMTIKELAELMAEVAGHGEPGIAFDRPRDGDIRSSQGDFLKARKMLGYKPKRELRRGLKELLEEVAKSSRIEEP